MTSRKRTIFWQSPCHHPHKEHYGTVNIQNIEGKNIKLGYVKAMVINVKKNGNGKDYKKIKLQRKPCHKDLWNINSKEIMRQL